MEAAKNAYEAWVKTNMIAYYGSTIKFDDISGDGIPELLIYTSGDDLYKSRCCQINLDKIKTRS